MTREREDLQKIFTWSPVLSKEEINNIYKYLKNAHDVSWINGDTLIKATKDTITITNAYHIVTIELIGNCSAASLSIDGYRIFDFLVHKVDESCEVYSPFTKSTMFGLWTRQEKEIASSKKGEKGGYGSTNLDYVWAKMKSWEKSSMEIEYYMLIEEKTYDNFTDNKNPTPFQEYMFKYLHKRFSDDKLYRGCHIISFSKTTPDNGNVYIDGGLLHKSSLLRFMRFEDAIPQVLYRSYFEKKGLKNRLSITDYDLMNPYDILL